MIGCLVLAFALCQTGYYGGGGYYAQPQQVYYQQPVYQQPVYYAPPPPPVYYQPAPVVFPVAINVGGWGGGRGYYNQGQRYYRH